MAKPKKKSPASKTPTKASTAAKRRKQRRTTITKVVKETRETRSNPAANPPAAQDFTQVLLPGFGAFALTKVLQRIVYSIVQKRFPRLGKHAHALSGAVAFGGVWLFAHRVKALSKYHDGIVIGSGIAAAHGIAQCYLSPKYNWLLADCKAEDVKAATKNGSNGKTLPAAPTPADGDEYGYLEEQIQQLEGGAGKPSAPGTGAPVTDPALMEELGTNEDVDDLYTGTFGSN